METFAVLLFSTCLFIFAMYLKKRHKQPIAKNESEWQKINIGNNLCAFCYPELTLCVNGLVFPFRNEICIGYSRILKKASDDWILDKIECGVLVIKPENPQILSIHPLPAHLPMKKSGASGSWREFSPETIWNNKMVFCLKSPFSDNRGWGNDNFLFTFSPEAKQWCQLLPDKEKKWREKPVSEQQKFHEHADYSACGGEAVLWCENENLSLMADCTPYFLDDWETSPETRTAFHKRDAAINKTWHKISMSNETDDYSNTNLLEEEWRFKSRDSIFSIPENYRMELIRKCPVKDKNRLFLLGGDQISFNHQKYFLLLLRTFGSDKNADIILLYPEKI